MSRVRDDVMWALAYNLAQSGEYPGWCNIEVELAPIIHDGHRI